MVELKLNKIHQIRKVQLDGNKFRSIDHQFVEKKLTQTIQDYGRGIQRIVPHKSIEMFDYIIGNNFNFKSKHQHNITKQHSQQRNQHDNNNNEHNKNDE